ncbi:MAG: hypothetical protein AVDCRST_MAG18-3273 [uncultured Thermomicrobiales bacterium]|uniref:Uncharacterized protein n=1 Tax=uncultured Thermomicrobiales bacterium TaxID=1645740 RepID=A0A6J4VL48_9BACT|nr:MAG: hypothetical protein AVDCRST_MAG18-3273 [uncultured Thermomicrobiales bacterium]
MIGSDDFGRYSGAGRSRSFNMGGMLVGIGVLFLLWQLLSPTGALPLLILGGIFTGLALLKGIRGFTVPGGILLGLAGGLIVASLLRHVSGAFGGAAVLVGLGAGFWLIPTLDRLRHPYSNAFGWARIPGTILFCIAALPALIGTLSVAGRSLGFLLQFWPIFLIVGGLWLFFSNRRRGRARWS